MALDIRLTQDGSYTFFSEEFGESYHSLQGARTEAFEKFAIATDLAAKASSGMVRLLDICYGLGYNSAAALESLWTVNATCQVQLLGLELDATVPQQALKLETSQNWFPEVQQVLGKLAHEHQFRDDRVQAQLLIGDARQTLQCLAQQNFQADVIFLDPFSPRRCPQLWTVDFLTCVARCLSWNGVLATYSCSATVRAALQEAGLSIGTIPVKPHCCDQTHAWAQGTVANKTGEGLLPLSQMEQEHLQTRAGISLRDPQLCDPASTILARQSCEQTSSTRESTSSWRRRWQLD